MHYLWLKTPLLKGDLQYQKVITHTDTIRHLWNWPPCDGCNCHSYGGSTLRALKFSVVPLLLLTDSKITTDFAEQEGTLQCVCVDAAWPLSRLSGIMLCKWKAGWLSWPGCQWKGNFYVSSFTLDGSIGEMKAWSETRTASTQACTTISNLSNSCTNTHVELHWSGDWDGRGRTRMDFRRRSFMPQ